MQNEAGPFLAPSPMTFPPLATPDDIRKLQAEMQQLQNQQFLLATAALTVFGFAAWAAPRATTAASLFAFEGIHAASTVALLLLLSVLFAWSLSLHHLIITISYYLELRGASQWESDYRAFYTSTLSPHLRSKTRWVATIYFVLGLLVPGNFAAAIIVSGSPCSTIPISLVGGVSIVYLIAVFAFGLVRRHKTEIRDKWVRILGERYPAPAEPQQKEGSP